MLLGTAKEALNKHEVLRPVDPFAGLNLLTDFSHDPILCSCPPAVIRRFRCLLSTLQFGRLSLAIFLLKFLWSFLFAD